MVVTGGTADASDYAFTPANPVVIPAGASSETVSVSINGDEDVEGDETLTVMDSKYYAEGHDPVKESPSRSRLFSYAYLLRSDRLAFLCPLLEPRTPLDELAVHQRDLRRRTAEGQHADAPEDAQHLGGRGRAHAASRIIPAGRWQAPGGREGRDAGFCCQVPANPALRC